MNRETGRGSAQRAARNHAVVKQPRKTASAASPPTVTWWSQAINTAHASDQATTEVAAKPRSMTCAWAASRMRSRVASAFLLM